jgi:hypothetical protein
MASDREQEIRERAYRIWEEEGRPTGREPRELAARRNGDRRRGGALSLYQRGAARHPDLKCGISGWRKDAPEGIDTLGK